MKHFESFMAEQSAAIADFAVHGIDPMQWIELFAADFRHAWMGI